MTTTKKIKINSCITQETHSGYIWHVDVNVELSGIVQFTDINVTIALWMVHNAPITILQYQI